MGSSSSSGGWWPGKSYVEKFEGKKTRCYAGDDNHLLKLGEGALKVLDRQLRAHESWHLGWAIDSAKKVKEARKNKWSKVFMVEAVDGSEIW